jgi:hypothetical protein
LVILRAYYIFFTDSLAASAKSSDWDLHPDIKANLSTAHARNDSSSPQTVQLFVYGTLKSGFQWNSKYLHSRLGAQFVCSAVTCQSFALVLGESGVPYLLGDVMDAPAAVDVDVATATDAPIADSEVRVEMNTSITTATSPLHRIQGELWVVDSDCLAGSRRVSCFLIMCCVVGIFLTFVFTGLDDYEGVGCKGYYERREIAVQKTGSLEGETVESACFVVFTHMKNSRDVCV